MNRLQEITVEIGTDAIFDDRLRPGQQIPVMIGAEPKPGDLVAVVYLEPYRPGKMTAGILGVCKIGKKAQSRRARIRFTHPLPLLPEAAPMDEGLPTS